DVETELAQLRRDEGRRAFLLVRELRMRVQVAAPCGELVPPGVELGNDARDAFHEPDSSPRRRRSPRSASGSRASRLEPGASACALLLVDRKEQRETDDEEH